MRRVVCGDLVHTRDTWHDKGRGVGPRDLPIHKLWVTDASGHTVLELSIYIIATEEEEEDDDDENKAHDIRIYDESRLSAAIGATPDEGQPRAPIDRDGKPLHHLWTRGWAQLVNKVSSRRLVADQQTKHHGWPAILQVSAFVRFFNFF